MRALQTDGMNPTVLGLILMTALVAFWCCWLVFGRVSVYEISAAARLEAERVHPVAATVGGRIVASHLSLAREVRSGDVLLEIESDRERLETVEERRRLAALRTRLRSSRPQIPAEEEAHCAGRPRRTRSAVRGVAEAGREPAAARRRRSSTGASVNSRGGARG